MFTFKPAQAKNFFFDRQTVIDATDKAERKVLSQFGAFVRTRARSSIRARKKVSAAGQPPASHTGTLKKYIYFAFDPGARSVVIGPALLNGDHGQMSALEHGGETTILLGGKRRGKRKRVTIAARPFMGPAFDAEKKASLDPLWRDAIKG